MSGSEADDDDPPRPGMRTRRSNRTAHPGVKAMERLAVGQPPATKRRTSAEVQAEKAAVEAAKAAAEAEKEEHIAKIARLENRMEGEEELLSVAVSNNSTQPIL